MLHIAPDSIHTQTLVAPIDRSGADRRRHPRSDVRIRAEARRIDNTLLARRNPKMSLTLYNISSGGLFAMTRSPVEAGERLAVTIPQGVLAPMQKFVGRVIRCEPRLNGWRIAMSFDTIPAA